MIGNEKPNQTEKSFDDGNFCAICETIALRLKGNASLAQDDMEGIYYYSSMVNGKPSWTSMHYALWYAIGYWLIGDLHSIGEFTGGIYSYYGSQCPYNLSSDKWYYFQWDGDWMIAETNEINVLCLDGKYLKSQTGS